MHFPQFLKLAARFKIWGGKHFILSFLAFLGWFLIKNLQFESKKLFQQGNYSGSKSGFLWLFLNFAAGYVPGWKCEVGENFFCHTLLAWGGFSSGIHKLSWKYFFKCFRTEGKLLIFVNFLEVFPFRSKFELGGNFFCQRGLAWAGLSWRIYNLSRKMFSKHITISTHYLYAQY